MYIVGSEREEYTKKEKPRSLIKGRLKAGSELLSFVSEYEELDNKALDSEVKALDDKQLKFEKEQKDIMAAAGTRDVAYLLHDDEWHRCHRELEEIILRKKAILEVRFSRDFFRHG